MNILVTAGNTIVPIDRVRCITNVFTGRTGTAIALHCHHGVRSRAAAEQLLREGFTNVYNLEGGIEAWSREVDPSVPRY